MVKFAFPFGLGGQNFKNTGENRDFVGGANGVIAKGVIVKFWISGSQFSRMSAGLVWSNLCWGQGASVGCLHCGRRRCWPKSQPTVAPEKFKAQGTPSWNIGNDRAVREQPRVRGVKMSWPEGTYHDKERCVMTRKHVS